VKSNAWLENAAEAFRRDTRPLVTYGYVRVATLAPKRQTNFAPRCVSQRVSQQVRKYLRDARAVTPDFEVLGCVKDDRVAI
jgi:hypothetical protein